MESINRRKELPFNYANTITNLMMSSGELDKVEKVLNSKKELKVHYFGNPRTEKKVTAMDYGTWGNLYTYRNNLTEAENYYNKALKIFLELDNQSEGLGITYANLGGIYEVKKDYSDSIKYWKEALFIFSVIGDKWRGELVNNWIIEIEKKI